MTLVTTILPWTIAVYIAFGLFFGGTLLATDFSGDFSCGNPVSCVASFFTGAFDVVHALFDFVTLGALSGISLSIWTRGILLLYLGTSWTLIIAGILRGSHVG